MSNNSQINISLLNLSSDLEQFLSLRSPQLLFFDHVSCSDGLQPITELCKLWPLKKKAQ